MSFDIKIGDEVVKSYDVDPMLVDGVEVNGVRQVIASDVVDLTIKVTFKSAQDGEVLERKKRDAIAELQKEFDDAGALDENPVSVALEAEFGPGQNVASADIEAATAEGQEDEEELDEQQRVGDSGDNRTGSDRSASGRKGKSVKGDGGSDFGSTDGAPDMDPDAFKIEGDKPLGTS